MKNSQGVGKWPNEEPDYLIRLRELIAALTMPEKNTFKRRLRSHSDQNQESDYVLLFDCINECLLQAERQKRQARAKPGSRKPDDFYPQFQARYRLRQLGSPDKLMQNATYLYERILAALRAHNTQQVKRQELYGMMLDIQLLDRKGLQIACLERTRAARALAMEIEADAQVVELIQMEFRLLLLAQKDLLGQLKQLHEVEHSYLRRLETNMRLKNLRWELHLARLDPSDSMENPALWDQLAYFCTYIQANPVPDNFNEAYHSQTILSYLILLQQRKPSVLLNTYIQQLPVKTLVDHHKNIVDLYARYPERKKESPRKYWDELFNYLLLALAYDIPIDIEDYHTEINNILPSDPHFLRNVVSFWLTYYVRERKFKEAKEFLQKEDIWHLVKQKGHLLPVSRLEALRYMAGAVCFGREEYQDASRWFSANLQDTPPISNVVARRMSVLYELLARFEIGLAPDLVSERLETLRKAFPHLPGDGSVEQHVVSSVEAALKAGKDPILLPAIAKEALAILEAKLAPEPATNHAYGLFLAWLKSRVLQRSLRSVLDAYI